MKSGAVLWCRHLVLLSSLVFRSKQAALAQSIDGVFSMNKYNSSCELSNTRILSCITTVRGVAGVIQKFARLFARRALLGGCLGFQFIAAIGAFPVGHGDFSFEFSQVTEQPPKHPQGWQFRPLRRLLSFQPLGRQNSEQTNLYTLCLP